jgi:hypothetical protein
MKSLTASDRASLIRLAASLPVGGGTRRAILAGLSKVAADEMIDVNVGDILVSSWGYDQTNVDFYEVAAKSGSMATFYKIDKRVVGGRGEPSEKVVPVPGAWKGPPLRKKVKPGWRPGTVAIRLTSYSSAYTWDGKPQEQTGAAYGH